MTAVHACPHCKCPPPQPSPTAPCSNTWAAMAEADKRAAATRPNSEKGGRR